MCFAKLVSTEVLHNPATCLKKYHVTVSSGSVLSSRATFHYGRDSASLDASEYSSSTSKLESERLDLLQPLPLLHRLAGEWKVVVLFVHAVSMRFVSSST